MTPSHMTVTIEEADRQMVLLALAELWVKRPGWHYAIEEVAKKFDPEMKPDPEGLFHNLLASVSGSRRLAEKLTGS